MGVLLYNTHISKQGSIPYAVEIHDNQFSDSPIDFDMRGDGFVLRYQGEDDRFATFIPSKVSFGVVVENASIDTALDTIISSSEGRFFCVVKKGTTTEWVGRLFYEEFRRENKPYPYTFNLSFTDGLASLKTKDYDNVQGFTRQVLLDIIFYCLEQIGINDFFTPTNRYFISSVNWLEFNQAIETDKDALILTNVDHRAFLKDDETTELLSCYEILKEICKIFGARLLFSEGAWRFIQVNEMTGATVKEIRYAKDKTVLSSAPNVSLSVDINNTNIKLGGSGYRYLPGLKSVKLTYNHRSDNNFAAAIKWDFLDEQEFLLGDFEFNDDDEIFVRLKIHFKVELNAYLRHYLRWRFTLKVGNYWLKREVETRQDSSIKTHNHEWSNTEAFYDIVYHDDSNELEDYNGTIELSFQTPPVPVAEGEVRVQLEGVGAVYYNGVVHSPSNIELSSWATGSKTVVELISNGDIALRENSRTYEIENTDFPNNSIKKTIDTIIGDGTTKTSLGKLQVWNGTFWEDSQFWSVGEINENLLIQELLIQEILRGRKQTIHYFEGAFQSLFHGHDVLQYDGKRFALSQATFKSNIDRWNGTWFEIGATTGASFPIGGVVIKTPIPNTNDVLEFENVQNDPIATIDQKDKNNIIGILEGIKKGNVAVDIAREVTISEITLGGFTTFQTGQTGRIINPNTGDSETFTVLGIATTTGNLEVLETFAFDYPQGSYVIGEDSVNSAVSTVQKHKVLGYSGAFIDVPFDLPIEEDEVDKRLTVLREYATGIYGITYSIINDGNGDRRRITPTIPFNNEGVLIKLINT